MTRSNLEYPDCPICKSGKYLRPYYNHITSWEFPGRYSYVRCSQCKLIMQSPREKISSIAKYYKPRSYWGQDVSRKFVMPDFIKERNKHYRPVYSEILSRKISGRILDVGSGLGLFLSLFRESGWQVMGTETSEAVASFARKTFHIPVKVGLLEKIKFSRSKFDVISLIGVFEHIYTPEKTLSRIHQLLAPGGLLVIVPPNINSLGHYLFRSQWYSLDPGRHLYHYSPETITRMLEQSGFRVIKITHIIGNTTFIVSSQTSDLLFHPASGIQAKIISLSVNRRTKFIPPRWNSGN